MNIKDSTFLVTGGSAGIGKATAKLLVEKGGKAAITGRDKTKLDKVAKEIGAFPIHADVAVENDVHKTYELFLKEFGKLDCLVNNAGIGDSWNELTELDMKAFHRVYDVNVFGAIASTAGTKGFANGTVYASSKFALRGMTQCWQAELRKYNVRVILVNPSEVTTAFGDNDRNERPEVKNKLRPLEIAHTIVSTLEMDDRGFIQILFN